MPENEKDELMTKVEFAQGPPVIRSGNTFTAFVTPIKNMHEARTAYKAMLLVPENMAATHTIACATLFEPLTAKVTIEHADDRDFGMGKELEAHLIRNNVRNIAVFVCREYSGVHLGQERFTALKHAVDLALDKYRQIDTK